MRTILVAEDDASMRRLLVEVLELAGWKVLAFGDGAQAWERLQKGGADMAVLDINMPGLDGLEVVRRVRSHPRLKALPMVLLTIRDLVEDEIRGYQGGADDYLTKPFDGDVLVAKLKVLERRLLGPAAPSS